MAEDESETPEWEDVIREAIEARLLDVHVALPGRAEGDAGDGVVPVKPLVRRSVRTTSGGLVEESLPVLPAVPIATLRAGGMFLSVPVKKGDHGLLLFCEAAIDRYRSLGEDAPAGDVRLHGLSGAVFWPGGVVPRSQALASAHADNLVLGEDGGVTLHVDPAGSLIHAGSFPAADFVALAAAVRAELQVIVDAIKGGVPVAMDGGAALQASIVALLNDPVPSVAATKLRAD